MLYATGFFSNRIYCHPHEELKGETACWGHYFNDFIGVLLLQNLDVLRGRLLGSHVNFHWQLGGQNNQNSAVQLCVLLLLPLIGWTSIKTCIGKNCKLGLFFCSKSLVDCLNFKLIVRGGVEETRLEAKDTKKNSGPRTDPLEAKARPSFGQGPRTQAQVFSKKKRSSK